MVFSQVLVFFTVASAILSLIILSRKELAARLLDPIPKYASMWFDLLKWLFMIGAVTFVAKINENLVLQIIAGLSYVALYFYIFFKYSTIKKGLSLNFMNYQPIILDEHFKKRHITIDEITQKVNFLFPNVMNFVLHYYTILIIALLLFFIITYFYNPAYQAKGDIMPILSPQKDCIFSIMDFFSSSDIFLML